MADQESSIQTLTSENRAEFMAEKLNLSDEPEEIEVKEIEEPEQEEQEEETPEQKEEKKGNPKLQKRFSELTQQREQARQEAANLKAEKEALEARLQKLEGNTQVQKNNESEVSSDRPDAANYQDAFKYAEDLALWSGKQALIERDKQEQQAKIEQEQNKVITAWSERLNTFKKDTPDFDDMVNSADVLISDEVRDAILESDVGPAVLYHLANNPDEANALKTMSQSSALRYIGKLEAKLEVDKEPIQNKQEVSVSKAPAPISPIRSGKQVPDAKIDSNGEFTGDYEEYKRLRKAGKIN